MERHQLADFSRELKQTPSSPTLASMTDRDNRRVLWKHQYSRPHRGETDKLIVRNWVSYAVVFVSLCLVVLVVLGCTLPTFSLDVLGLIGVAVESGQDFNEATKYFNVFTVVQLLFDEARFLDDTRAFIGLGTLSFLFITTVLLVPILQAFVLLRMWFVPMNMRQRTRMSTANEILQAWQYCEVFLIAIFVASWQLGPISQFMVNSYCGSLDGFFGQMVYFGILKEDDAQCFSVQSSIEHGSFVLAAGAILLALLNTFVSKAVRQYIHDKSTLERRVLDEKFEANLGHHEPADEAGLSCTDQDDDEKKTTNDDGSSISIHPVPVMFTDTFRWLLRGDYRDESSSRGNDGQYESSFPSSSVEGTDNGKGLSFDDSTTMEIQDPSSRSNVIAVVDDDDDDDDGVMKMHTPSTNTVKTNMVDRHHRGPDASDCGSTTPLPLSTSRSDDDGWLNDSSNIGNLQIPHGIDSKAERLFDVMIDDAYVFDDENDI